VLLCSCPSGQMASVSSGSWAVNDLLWARNRHRGNVLWPVRPAVKELVLVLDRMVFTYLFKQLCTAYRPSRLKAAAPPLL
jgi:hypothetical protein